MGNPHYVLFVSDFAEHWQAKASEIQSSSEFTQGVNVEIVVIDGEHDVRARFFERGVGETNPPAQVPARALAALGTGRVQSPVRVCAPGGTQTVRQEENLVFLRGAAT